MSNNGVQNGPRFRGKNQALFLRAAEILEEERPMTLRQLYYRVVSVGLLENSQAEYRRLGNGMTRLREAGQIARTWIVDRVRSTIKPSSWCGLADFGAAVCKVYRKDLWAGMPHHLEVFVEKDAIAGTIQPVTREYDVALQVCRGYTSVSFAGEIADLWAEICKPIYCYYLGDFDPSGFDLERDLKEKLQRYSGRSVCDRYVGQDDGADSATFRWERLAVLPGDFEQHDLITLPVKQSDRRAQAFIERHGHACAEVDALPPAELRRRVEGAILAHVDRGQWERLLLVQTEERERLRGMVEGWGGRGES